MERNKAALYVLDMATKSILPDIPNNAVSAKDIADQIVRLIPQFMALVRPGEDHGGKIAARETMQREAMNAVGDSALFQRLLIRAGNAVRMGLQCTPYTFQEPQKLQETFAFDAPLV